MVADRALAAVSRQLGRPTGPAGRVVGRVLNRSNRALVAAAVDAVAAGPGATVVDVGFGGGVGLQLLLDRVGAAGVVHGVEISETMLAGACGRFRRQIAAGRLQVHDATMEQLPMPAGSVDAVVSTNTIYFIDDLQPAFVELARVLRPGGRLAVGVGDPDAMAQMAFTRHGFTLRPVADIVDQGVDAGFTVPEVRRPDGGSGSVVVVCERPASA